MKTLHLKPTSDITYIIINEDIIQDTDYIGEVFGRCNKETGYYHSLFHNPNFAQAHPTLDRISVGLITQFFNRGLQSSFSADPNIRNCRRKAGSFLPHRAEKDCLLRGKLLYWPYNAERCDVVAQVLLVIAVTAVLFLGMILLLAAKPRFAGKITGTFIVTVGVGGLIVYGYGFAVTAANLPLAIVRALLAVCGMYVGKNDLSAISSAPLMQNGWMLVIFWVLHLLALYATASTVITTVGAEALKKLRAWLVRRGKLNLIYGLNADSLELSKELVCQKDRVVVVIDPKPDAAMASAAANAGCVIRSDAEALAGTQRFLRSMGVGPKREVTLYAVRQDSADNLQYAKKCLGTFEKQGVQPQALRLVILGQEDLAISHLQVTPEKYGYGFVSAVQTPELVARLLMCNYPPCDRIRFDENCAATEDMNSLIVGFGQTGQAVLKHLVMNGQFEGSRFRAAVFAPDCRDVTGYFSCTHRALLERYDISFHPYDARSEQMFHYLQENADKLKYAVICTGNQRSDHEIAEELTGYLYQLGAQMDVYVCGHGGIKAYGPDGVAFENHRLFTAEHLSKTKLDYMAMQVNQSYQGKTEASALENWMRCDYFSRQSCRAMADFTHAYLRAAGKEPLQALENWEFTPLQLENLSRTEHRRWCAFHYAMGFAPMSREEWHQRADQYRREEAQTGKGKLRIAKNLSGRTHACLTDWDGLAELSQREEAVTGKKVDYQYLDTQNVLAIPQLLKAEKGENA